MEKKLIYLLVFLVIAVSLGFFLTDPFKLLRRVEVSGIVKDLSNGGPVEMAEVTANGEATFTNFNGEFLFESLRDPVKVGLNLPDAYEPFGGSLFCLGRASEDLYHEKSFCEAHVVPKAETTAFGWTTLLATGKKEGGLAIRARHEKEWMLMHPDSQAVWGDRAKYVESLYQKDLIDRENEVNIVSTKIVSGPTPLSSYTDAITRKDYRGVAEFVVRRTLASGKVTEEAERFAKVDGFWHHLTEYDPVLIKSYIDPYKWLVKMIEEEEAQQ